MVMISFLKLCEPSGRDMGRHRRKSESWEVLLAFSRPKRHLEELSLLRHPTYELMEIEGVMSGSQTSLPFQFFSSMC
jgi:hypothetical protein